ncbi:hypothetical protein EGR_08345 [Echinococcus granulosus]|uniref:Uncharacterized protein n=1 Tax=Echinococcus granulosus TaxID=6210 RepID=W6UF37_ECHGR|nr:hypothetical protein EGR_08345 [Echinococcus granulosus]EUB56767.1 hypothetical protein EGR_08345 [Echinococcus granulosus]
MAEDLHYEEETMSERSSESSDGGLKASLEIKEEVGSFLFHR